MNQVDVRPRGLTTDPGEQVASWSLPPDVSSVPRARHLTRAWLADWGLEGLAEVAELLVSELVTNALCHARGPYRLTLHATDDLLSCEVEDADAALPYLCQAGEDDEHHRGLGLLDLLARDWGSEPTPEGKTVWFELPAVERSGAHADGMALAGAF